MNEKLEKTILSFKGKVISVKGNIAQVCLRSKDKKEDYAEIELKNLKTPRGVEVDENYWFYMIIVRVSGELKTKFEYIPPKKLTSKDYKRIDRELDEVLLDYLLRD